MRSFFGWLRWLLVAPTFLGGLIGPGYLLTSFLYWLENTANYSDWDEWLGPEFALVYGFTAVFLPGLVAPAKKWSVSLACGALVVGLASILFIRGGASSHYRPLTAEMGWEGALVFTALTALGAGIAVFNFRERKPKAASLGSPQSRG